MLPLGKLIRTRLSRLKDERRFRPWDSLVLHVPEAPRSGDDDSPIQLLGHLPHRSGPDCVGRGWTRDLILSPFLSYICFGKRSWATLPHQFTEGGSGPGTALTEGLLLFKEFAVTTRRAT